MKSQSMTIYGKRKYLHSQRVMLGLEERACQAIPRWYGHVVRMTGGRNVRMIHETGMPEVRTIGRLRKKWANEGHEFIKT